MRRGAPVSLRNRVSLVLVAVVAVALLGANAAVYAVASDGLDRQLEEQLGRLSGLGDALAIAMEAGMPVDRGVERLSIGEREGFSDEAGDFIGPTVSGRGGEYVGLVEPGGSRSVGFFADERTITEEELALPDDLAPEPGEPVFFDTHRDMGDGSAPYRARAAVRNTGTIVVVGIPTTEAGRARLGLLLLQVGTSLTLLLILALLSRRLVGVGLRPLAHMEQAAERIADGDLTHRVEPSGPQTEISRLGAALNRMLEEIEEAFEAEAESQRRLMASEQKLRRFVADASHEMRTPLTSIRGYAQLLRRDRIAKDEERTEAAGRIEDQATRLASLVDDLLLLARLDSEASFRSEIVAIEELAGQVVDDARVVDPDRTISFEADEVSDTGHEGEERWDVRGDPEALTRVLTNLVANACRHTPPGSPVEVAIHGSEGDDGQLQVVVDVVDHGDGIPPELRPDLFNRFFRADESRTRDRGGAGLGLAIVSGLVTAHNGRCEVLDTEGGGVTFRVVLPRSTGNG